MGFDKKAHFTGMILRADRRVDEALDQIEERTKADRQTAARILRDVQAEEGGIVDKRLIALAIRRIKNLT